MNHASNNFGTVGVTGATVILRDTNAVVLGTSTVTGTYLVTAGGAVTQSGALAIASNTTTISASGSDVTLNDASNDFATIGVTGADVKIRDAGAVALGASTVSGTYLVTAVSGGDITNTGTLDIEGVATFTVAGGRSITVASGSNDFTATPVFSSGGTIANVEIKDNSALVLAGSALTLSGDLTVTVAGGAVTQTNQLVVPGTTTISAASQDVTLNHASNN